MVCVGLAQSAGTITGRVSDSTGAGVPGASVVATNTGTGVARNTVSNTSGSYGFATLPQEPTTSRRNCREISSSPLGTSPDYRRRVNFKWERDCCFESVTVAD